MKLLPRWLANLIAEREPQSYNVVLYSPRGRVTAENVPTLAMAQSRLRAAQRRRTAARGEIVTDAQKVIETF